MTRCKRCKGTNILQEASIMLDPNDPESKARTIFDDLFWEDYFYCNDCEEETEAEEE